MLISSPIQVLPSILSMSIGPILSALSVGKNRRLQSSLMKSAFRYVMLVSLLASVMVVMYSRNLVLLFSREEYLPAVSIFPFVCLATVLLSAGDVFNTCLYSIGKAKIQRNVILVSVAAFLASSVPLTYLFSATGMAISYAVSMLVLSYLSYHYTNKFVSVKLDIKPVFKIIISSAVMAALIYFSSSLVTGLVSLLIFGLFFAIFYFALLVPMKFYNKDDVKVIMFVGEKVPALRKLTDGLAGFLSRFV
jgi:O-antigen/teichoic acid export membrane protein